MAFLFSFFELLSKFSKQHTHSVVSLKSHNEETLSACLITQIITVTFVYIHTPVFMNSITGSFQTVFPRKVLLFSKPPYDKMVPDGYLHLPFNFLNFNNYLLTP